MEITGNIMRDMLLKCLEFLWILSVFAVHYESCINIYIYIWLLLWFLRSEMIVYIRCDLSCIYIGTTNSANEM